MIIKMNLESITNNNNRCYYSEKKYWGLYLGFSRKTAKIIKKVSPVPVSIEINFDSSIDYSTTVSAYLKVIKDDGRSIVQFRYSFDIKYESDKTIYLDTKDLLNSIVYGTEKEAKEVYNSLIYSEIDKITSEYEKRIKNLKNNLLK